jgi:hypothetical protein
LTLKGLKTIIKELKKNLRSRFLGIFNHIEKPSTENLATYSDPLYLIAVVLDPNHKLYWLERLDKVREG